MPADPVAVLAVKNVGYRYGQNWALSDIAFSLKRGTLTVLAGRNGAGKSTLLRCLAGWAQPTRGQVELLGVPMYSFERQARARVLLVPDTPPFYDELTEWEHAQFIAQANRLSGWQAPAESWLRQFGLWAARDAYPFSLSRGMRYKLALCLALMLTPPLLLLDEPLGPLDPVSAGLLWDELERRRNAGMTILLSSHQTPPVDPDRYLLMENGILIGDIPGSEAAAGQRTLEELLTDALGRRDA
ncbi:MAG: ATP-binding cassette domain-containing protein [Nitrososphaerales archaeon]